MAGTPTRCGYCGGQTVTRAGICPGCGHAKRPPATMEPPTPPPLWREVAGQIAALAVTVLVLITAILIGSQILLFLAILVFCALAVLLVVAHGIP